jgi:hypothetical protein
MRISFSWRSCTRKDKEIDHGTRTGSDSLLRAFLRWSHIAGGEVTRLAALLGVKRDEDDFGRKISGLVKIMEAFRSLEEYPSFRRALASLEEVKYSSPCRQGGGTSACDIRICCREREYEGCRECDECENCTIRHFLEPVNGDSHARNLRKLRNGGITPSYPVKRTGDRQYA